MTTKQVRTMFKSYEMQAEEELKGRVFSFSHQKAMGEHIQFSMHLAEHASTC